LIPAPTVAQRQALIAAWVPATVKILKQDLATDAANNHQFPPQPRLISNPLNPVNADQLVALYASPDLTPAIAQHPALIVTATALCKTLRTRLGGSPQNQQLAADLLPRLESLYGNAVKNGTKNGDLMDLNDALNGLRATLPASTATPPPA
ncbi:MAG: hypothetical protein ABI743_12355, partial [bacterium]